jgi:hypothetical protein
MVMTDKTIDLDQHRGMAQATDLRRLLADVEANERALRLRQDELESHLIAAPVANLARSCREGPLSSQSLCCYVDVGGSAQTRVHRGRAGRLQAAANRKRYRNTRNRFWLLRQKKLGRMMWRRAN